jgi:cytochrome c
MIVRALIVTSSLLALAACSGGAKKSETETTTNETSSTNVTAAAETPAAAPAAANTAAAAKAPAADDTTTLSGAKFADFKGDPKFGETVFLQCKTCHVAEEGQNRIGPSLYHVVGRHSGTIANYQYSAANKNSGITWTKEKLFQYLENPQRVVPGTKMSFAGIQDPQKRADVIEYLATK